MLLESKIYVSGKTRRNLDAYALLAGVPTADHAAELLLTRALESEPEVQELNQAIAKVVKPIREQWQETHRLTAGQQ